MYLVDKQIREMAGQMIPCTPAKTGNNEANEVREAPFIDNFDPEAAKNIAYDLHIREIITETREKGHSTAKKYMLLPGGCVFISTKEVINLPNNIFAKVIPRNTCIRQGLAIEAPVFRPGHHTRIFVRVNNVADKKVELEEGKSICSLMFYQLEESVERPYNGAFVDEFDYKGAAFYHSSEIPKAEKAATKSIDKLKDAEKEIYGNVLTLMTIFIGIFSLVNLNINFLQNVESIRQLFAFDAIFLSGMSVLVLLISLILPGEDEKRKQKQFVFAGAALILLLVAALLI